MEQNTCPICDRPLGEVRISRHHLVPKTFGGRETELMHDICHRKIHATFSERQLEKEYNTVEAIMSNPDMQAFRRWVAKKEPDYYDISADSQERKRRRRR